MEPPVSGGRSQQQMFSEEDAFSFIFSVSSLNASKSVSKRVRKSACSLFLRITTADATDTTTTTTTTVPPSSQTLLCETEIVQKENSPTWQPVVINCVDIADVKSPLQLEVFNFTIATKEKLIGRVTAPFDVLLYSEGRSWDLTKQKQNKTKQKGKLKLERIGKAQPRDKKITAYDITFLGKDLGVSSVVGSIIKANGYLKIFAHPYRKTASGKWVRTQTLQVISTTEVVPEKSSQVFWEPVRVFLRDSSGLHVPIEVKVYSHSGETMREDILIGKVKTTLHQLLQNQFTRVIINYSRLRENAANYSPHAVLQVVKVTPVYDLPPDFNQFTLTVKARGLDIKDTITLTSNPVLIVTGIPVPRVRYYYVSQDDLLKVRDFEIATPVVASSPTIIYHSEIVKKTRECTWEPFQLYDGLCGGLYNPIQLLVYDINKDTFHPELIGECTTSLHELTLRNSFFRLDNPAKKSLVHGQNTGTLEVSTDNFSFCKIPHPNTLFEYKIKVRAYKVPKDTEFRILARPHGHASIYSIFDETISSDEITLEFILSPSRCGGMDCPIIILLINSKKKQKGKLITSLRFFTFWEKNPYFVLPKAAKPQKPTTASAAATTTTATTATTTTTTTTTTGEPKTNLKKTTSTIPTTGESKTNLKKTTKAFIKEKAKSDIAKGSFQIIECTPQKHSFVLPPDQQQQQNEQEQEQEQEQKQQDDSVEPPLEEETFFQNHDPSDDD